MSVNEIEIEKGHTDEEIGKMRTFLMDFVKVIDGFLIKELPIDNNDVITIDNKLAEEALGFIYDLVFDSEGNIPNPYEGDFSTQSLFCRMCYSQIEKLRQKIVEKIPKPGSQEENLFYIRLLPYFSEDGRNRICAVETVWCLGIIKEALSPEIGWIFIDTLTSQEYVEKRARAKRGFPHGYEDLMLMKEFDPDAYEILLNIIDTKGKKENIENIKRRLIKPELGDEEFKKSLNEFFKGKYNRRDIGQILDFMGKNNKNGEFTHKKKKLEERSKLTLEKTQRVSELSCFENGNTSFSRVLANRPFAYRVESILHDEIVKLFSPQGRRDWYSTLSGDSHSDKSDQEISEKLKAFRKNENGKLEKDIIKSAIDQMYERLVFEFITAVPNEDPNIWPKS
jgi:hypothetical protein